MLRTVSVLRVISQMLCNVSTFPSATAIAEGSLTLFFFYSSRRRHTRFDCDWSSDVCSSDLGIALTASSLVIMPILGIAKRRLGERLGSGATAGEGTQNLMCAAQAAGVLLRSEERRVGKECRSRWSPYH